MQETCAGFPQIVIVERQLFENLLGKRKSTNPKALFILGAPRTGSTILYQALCSGLNLPYISNFTNMYFPRAPILGLAIQKSFPIEICFSSQYGKTEGIFQPSEGSAVMAHWFGGGHPSAIVSNTILNGRAEHFLSTLGATEALFGSPIAIKNAWNCFRIRYLAEALPEACFIWIRRDVSAAAKSDLAARFVTQGSQTEWNSATPANVDKLRKLPPEGQVVENQFAYAKAISHDLRCHASGRWVEVWYEDFRRNPVSVLDRIACALRLSQMRKSAPVRMSQDGNWELSEAARSAIDGYVERHKERLMAMVWHGNGE